MSKIKYNISQIPPDAINEYEDYSSVDKQVLDSFEVISNFDPFSNNVELHIYSVDGERLKSINPFSNYSFLQTSETATGKAYTITLDPAKDSVNNNYKYGGVNLLYNFTDNLFSDTKNPVKFILKEISGDRTELKLKAVGLEDSSVVAITNAIAEDLNSSSDFNDFRVNLGNNDLAISVNIDTRVENGETFVIVKLYESLPEIYEVNNLAEIQSLVSDSVAFEVDSEVLPDEIKIPLLKGPNFTIEIEQENNNTSDYFNYNELFSFPTSNTYRQLNSLAKQKNIDISIDYSDFTNFVHFSSAQERLENFKYKFDLITAYQDSIDTIEAVPSVLDIEESGSIESISGSRSYYSGLINNILENFDHYDRFLYYESGSHSWPKDDLTHPYVNATGSATGSWYDAKIASASLYDGTNLSSLRNSIPVFLKDDPENDPYNLFVDMVGQHFDNIWIYAKAVTDKYDNDNRLNRGISKELVEEVLKNYGLKLYTSNRSTQDLFKMFTGEFYDTGSEDINTFLTASNDTTSEQNYRKQVYKRIYHNLPLLLKSKGTERGLRALMNCFGIPNIYSSGSHNGMFVRHYGGENTEDGNNYGPAINVSSSVDKVRFDNTGSIVSGNTLSVDTSIVKRDIKYTDDIPVVDIGYSPSDPIDDYIKSQLTTLNIDEYIGDPGSAFDLNYQLLVSASNAIEYDITETDLQDLTRILKFYDNVIFKMVRDFVPARTNVSSGIIIKPHILNRSKARLVSGSHDDFIVYTGSIGIASIESTDGGVYGGSNQISSSYTTSLMTSGGLATYDYHNDESAKFDGELSGSLVTVSTSELNLDNTFKSGEEFPLAYTQHYVNSNLDCTVDFFFLSP